MKTLLFSFGLIASTLIANNHAQAQTLWQKTAYGMTVDQVKALYPKIHKTKLPGPPSYALDETTILDARFGVVFWFDAPGDRLAEVILDLQEKWQTTRVEVLAETIADLLRSKFGASTIDKDHGPTPEHPEDIGLIWTTPDKTRITYTYFGDTTGNGAKNGITITYDGAYLKLAEQL